MDNLENQFNELKSAIFLNKYSFLNDEQRKGVFNVNGPLLILAGAGSGKTTVIVNRVAFLIKYGNGFYENNSHSVTAENIKILSDYLKGDVSLKEKVDNIISCNKVDARNILTITFTNKAASELKSRIYDMLGDDALDVWAVTFHSACVRILRQEIEALGFSKYFTIYDTDDKIKQIRECLRELNIDDKFLTPKEVSNEISKAKDKMQNAHKYLSENSDNVRLNTIGRVFKIYEDKLKSANALDFDDLIAKTVEILSNNNDVLKKWQQKFKYVLVDEYQDTNMLQYRLVSLFSKDHNNICVVGDDDQSIYKFRGATIENILNFEKQFTNSMVIKLERNYRSTQNILTAANEIISNNCARKGKSLWTSSGEGEKIYLYKASNQDDEAKFIVKNINNLLNNEDVNLNEIAILYRTNAQNRVITDVLTKLNIPNRVIGGIRFYDRAEIRDMLAYLSVISNPNDELRLRRIINVPARKIGTTTIDIINSISKNENISMLDVIHNADRHPALQRAYNSLNSFSNIISTLKEKVNKIPLNELYDELCDISNYINILKKENTDEAQDRIENLAELSSVIVEYMKSSDQPTLEGFLEQVQLVSDVDNYDNDAKAVTLMTIHSAKGLEFPVVFITGVEEGIFPSMQSSDSEDGLEEERRLAYVAVTRAKRRLYIIHANERLLFGSYQRNRISRFIGEIPEKLLIKEGFISKKDRLIPHKATGFVINESTYSKTNSSAITYNEGDCVSHRVFGTGKITKTTPMGNDYLLNINFDKVGVKKIMANFAGLKKISEC